MWTKDDKQYYSDMTELFRDLYAGFGETIFASRKLVAVCMDMAPNLSNEIRLVNIAVDAGIYPQIMSASKDSDAALMACIRRQHEKLIQSFFLSDVWAEQAIRWLLTAVLSQSRCDEIKNAVFSMRIPKG